MKRQHLFCELLSDEYPNSPNPNDRVPCSEPEANLVSSLLDDGQHAPILDLDVPHRYVASSTPGHGHLYIDVAMPWWKYRLLLQILASCGILEEKHVRASLERGATHVRKEGVKKKTIVDDVDVTLPGIPWPSWAKRFNGDPRA
jgi:hypothetical protein